jgi:ABC-type multidrug transport system ATPase subunit
MAIAYLIKEVTKVYKGSEKKANDQITLAIRQGEIFGLLGPNGAGKSTLINQIAGLTPPTSGSIQLFGMDVVRQPQIIPHYVALQPQQGMALLDLYPEEALLHTAQLRSCTKQEAQKQTRPLMEEFKLGQFGKKVMRNLSGGQRRLVHLALAFVGDRPIQIFDEPTNDLDPVVRLQVWEKLLHLHREGKTIIVVTHNVLEAERVIQRVGIINHGRLQAVGTIGELKAQFDQSIRLEVALRADYQLSDTKYRDLLATLGEVRALTQQHCIVLCYRSTTRVTIDRVLSQIGLDKLNDFRIQTPSLEDIYLQFGGETKRG